MWQWPPEDVGFTREVQLPEAGTSHSERSKHVLCAVQCQKQHWPHEIKTQLENPTTPLRFTEIVGILRQYDWSTGCWIARSSSDHSGLTSSGPRHSVPFFAGGLAFFSMQESP